MFLFLFLVFYSFFEDKLKISLDHPKFNNYDDILQFIFFFSKQLLSFYHCVWNIYFSIYKIS